VALISVHSTIEVERLVAVGVLNKGMSYSFDPDCSVFLSFCNIVEGRCLTAEFSHNSLYGIGFELTVSEEMAGHESEVVSVYRHASLEHLVNTAKGFLCCYNKTRSPEKRATKVSVTVRVDVDLQAEFEDAAEATGESQAVVLRQLMRFFIGKGPDPRAFR